MKLQVIKHMTNRKEREGKTVYLFPDSSILLLLFKMKSIKDPAVTITATITGQEILSAIVPKKSPGKISTSLLKAVKLSSVPK